MLYTLNRDREAAAGIKSDVNGSFVGLLFGDGTLEMQCLSAKADPFVINSALDFVFVPLKQTQGHVALAEIGRASCRERV